MPGGDAPGYLSPVRLALWPPDWQNRESVRVRRPSVLFERGERGVRSLQTTGQDKIMKYPLRGFAIVAVCALLVGAFGFQAAAEEESTGAKRWVLDMEHGPLKVVLLDRGDGRTEAYHYITVKVTNNTGFARPWYPLVKAITDTKDKNGQDSVYVAMGYDDALAAIRTQEGDGSLKSLGDTKKKIGDGETINGVAIFGPLDPLYDTIKLQIHGLADPVATYKIENYDGSSLDRGAAITEDKDWIIGDSAYWERNQRIFKRLRAQAAADGSSTLPTPNLTYVVITERRYWGMTYERLGDEFRPEDDLIRFKGEGWMVVGNPKKLRGVNEKDG